MYEFAWSQILKKINNCKLILKGSTTDADIAKLRILKSFENHNINKDRIIFEKYNSNRSEHLKMYYNIDICLDTFPYKELQHHLRLYGWGYLC